MSEEFRLVLAFVACALSSYAIGVSRGRTAAYRVCKRMMDELIELTGKEGRER